MKRVKKLLVLIGFIAQVIFFLIITGKLSLSNNLYIYYSLILFAVLLYNAFLIRKISRNKLAVIYLLSTIGAGMVSGVITESAVEKFYWLILDSVICGIVVMMLGYHLQNFLFNDEKGINSLLEFSLTIFAPTGYMLIAIFPFGLYESIVMILILFVLSLFLGYIIASSVKKSTDNLRRIIKDTSHREKTIGATLFKELNQELKDYLTGMDATFSEVNSIGKDIRGSAEDLSSASEQMNASLEEVSSTVQHIAKGAQEQSEAIAAIAEAIEELNNLTTSIFSQVKMANVSSKRTADSAKKGMDLSTHLARILKEIFEQTKFIEEKMAKLRDQAQEIKKIVDIIQGITEQTDLLALNAAIEAARVGEQGRGFAVVADEIRNLANETQRSSAIVENLIMEINKTTQELNNLLNLEKEKIDEANISASMSEDEFTGIAKAVELVTDMISRINEAAANQQKGTEELVKRVEQVALVANDTADATEEVSAAVEEQTAAMEEFTSTAQILAQIVAKLDEIIKKIK